MGMMQGKTALVVGGARGIGLAIAKELVEAGATVFLTGRDADAVDAAVAAVGAEQGIVADAASANDLDRVVGVIEGARGRLDAVVLNAGVSEPAALADETSEHFDRHFAVNVRGPLLALKAALRIMGSGGSVVLVGSVADGAGVPYFGTYAATKAALRSYARTWTAELASSGIRVNVVSPGPTDTAMMAVLPDEARAAMVAQIPLGRLARVDEVAAATVFLLSDKASFVAGAELCVDGGMAQV